MPDSARRNGSSRRLTAPSPLASASVSTAQSTEVAQALTGNTQSHDPSIIRVGDCYYGFSTSMNGVNGNTGPVGPWIYKTCDPTMLSGWEYIGGAFQDLPTWVADALNTNPTNIWAPDINYVNG